MHIGLQDSGLSSVSSYHNSAVAVVLQELMMDAMILAKASGHDVFNALDLMQNEDFLRVRSQEKERVEGLNRTTSVQTHNRDLISQASASDVRLQTANSERSVALSLVPIHYANWMEIVSQLKYYL